MRTLLPWIFGTVRLPAAADLALALPRLICGIILPVFFGLSKFPVPEWFISDVGKLGFPFPFFFAWAAVLTEVVGSFMLAAGLATRLVGTLLIITMCVAAFIQKADVALWERLPSLFFLLNAYFAVVLGSGRFGLDALIRRKLSGNVPVASLPRHR